MLTRRQSQIIKYLMAKKDWVKGERLADVVKVKKRTLQQEVKTINSYCHGTQNAIISNTHLGYHANLDICNNLSIFDQSQKQIVSDNMCNGRTCMLLMLLLYEKDFITIEEIANRFYVSKATINDTIKQLKRVLERNGDGIKLLVSHSKGLKLYGKESRLRILAVKSFDESIDYISLLRNEEFIKIDVMKRTLNIEIPSLLKKNYIILTGKSYEDFKNYIIICIVRSRLGFHIEEIEDNKISDFCQELSNSVIEKIGYEFSMFELINIQKRLDNLNRINKDRYSESSQFILEKFINNMKKYTGINVSLDQDLKINFGGHLERLILRAKDGQYNNSRLMREIYEKYPFEIHIIKSCLFPIMNCYVSDTELEYIVYYVLIMLEKVKRKYNIFIISDCSAGYIFYLKNCISNEFKEQINKITIIPKYLYTSYFNELKDSICITTDLELSLNVNNIYYLTPYKLPLNLNNIENYIKSCDNFKVDNYLKTLSQKKVFYINDLEEFNKYLDDFINNKNYTFEFFSEESLILIISSERFGYQKIIIKHPFEYFHKKIKTITIFEYERGSDCILDVFKYYHEVQ